MRAIASEMYEESSSMRYQALYAVSRSVKGLSQRTCESSNDASGISAQKKARRAPVGQCRGEAMSEVGVTVCSAKCDCRGVTVIQAS
jgi:hypothetical protein